MKIKIFLLINRFEEGPRITGSKFIDIDDISAQYDLYPSLNPKKLPHMMPPMVRQNVTKSECLSVGLNS